MTTLQERLFTCAETAQILRAALKQAFPGVKFGVRSLTYSGGSSIDVRWTDGPLRKDVEAVTQAYEGSRFDGMIDLKYSVSYYFRPDGKTFIRYNPGTESSHGSDPPEDNRVFEGAMPPGVIIAHFMADFIFCSRNLSDEAGQLQEATEWMYEHCVIENKTGDPNRDRWRGRWLIDTVRMMAFGRKVGEPWEETFKREG